MHEVNVMETAVRRDMDVFSSFLNTTKLQNVLPNNIQQNKTIKYHNH